MACKDFLSYSEEDNKIRWSGTETELKNFIKTFICVVDGWNDGKWEDDPKHNMLSYKTSKIVLKWYSTTKTIAHFTVAYSVTGPINGSEAAGDLVLIQTSLFLSCKLCCCDAN